METLKPRIRVRAGRDYHRVKNMLSRRYPVATVCEEALCPNIWECWNEGTATFMLLGDTCTRNCRFCYVKTGSPGGLVDWEEPLKVANAVREMKLDYVTITSVTRDDLPDGGASIFAETVRLIKKQSPHTLVEVLTPDFDARRELLETVIGAGVDVYGHNIETVRRLSPLVRDRRFSYEKSLRTLQLAKEISPKIVTKSSIILGMGEEWNEIIEAMKDLRSVGVDILVLGQYLRPSHRQLPVAKLYKPSEFKELEQKGIELGFAYVVSTPLARTSYKAKQAYFAALSQRQAPQQGAGA